MPDRLGQPEIEEAGTRDLDASDVGIGLEMLDQRRRDLARILAERLGDDHRGVGREIAMAGSRGGSTTARAISSADASG